MIIDFVLFVYVGEFFSFGGSIVGAVVESVSLPGGTGKFGPFDMVFQ